MSEQVEISSRANVVYVKEERQLRTMACGPRRLCVCILICTIIVLGAYTTITALAIVNNGLQGEIDRFKDENERLEKIEEEFRNQNSILTQQIQNLNETNSNLNGQVGQFRAQNQRYESSLNFLNNTIDGLTSQIVDLSAYQVSMAARLSSVNESNAELSEQLEQLEVAKQRLQTQLTQFNDLRNSIASYSKTNNNNFDTVVQDTLALFGNISYFTDLNVRVNLFSLALSAEFIEDNTPGFSQFEYDRFLSTAADQVGEQESQLEQEYPFSTQKNQTDMTFSQVADTIDTIWTQYAQP